MQLRQYLPQIRKQLRTASAMQKVGYFYSRILLCHSLLLLLGNPLGNLQIDPDAGVISNTENLREGYTHSAIVHANGNENGASATTEVNI